MNGSAQFVRSVHEWITKFGHIVYILLIGLIQFVMHDYDHDRQFYLYIHADAYPSPVVLFVVVSITTPVDL